MSGIIHALELWAMTLPLGYWIVLRVYPEPWPEFEGWNDFWAVLGLTLLWPICAIMMFVEATDGPDETDPPRGFDDKTWEAYLAEHDRAEELFRRKVCPRCGGLIVRHVVMTTSEPVQPWVNYRCARKCGWSIDRKETN